MTQKPHNGFPKLKLWPFKQFFFFMCVLHNQDNRGHKLKEQLAHQLCIMFTPHIQHSFSNPDLWADTHIIWPINKCKCAHAWLKLDSCETNQTKSMEKLIALYSKWCSIKQSHCGAIVYGGIVLDILLLLRYNVLSIPCAMCTHQGGRIWQLHYITLDAKGGTKELAPHCSVRAMNKAVHLRTCF